MDETGYELSAAYMNGLVKSVRDAGMLEAILVGLPADLRSAFTRPAMQSWWDAGFGERLVLQVFEQFGERAVEQVGYGVVAETMGPLVAPQVQALLSSGGSAPQTLFSNIQQFVSSAVRPVKANWTKQTETSGQLELQYPKPVRNGIPILWRGAIRYVFEITKTAGKIDREQHGEQTGKLLFDVSWS
jgi:hypothetical protein